MTHPHGGSGGAKADEFLKDEYDKAIDLVKYYDDRHLELLKFASALSAGIPTVVFGFYGLSTTAAEAVWDFATFIALITVFGLICIFAAMVRNRLYFVFPARQANVIRHALFKESTTLHNQMYSTRDVPILDWWSTQSLQLLFVALQIGLFTGITVYAFHSSTIHLLDHVKELVIGSGVVVVLVISAVSYLGARSDWEADDILRASAKKNTGRFEVVQDPQNRYHWRLVDAKGVKLAQSDFYTEKEACENNILLVKAYANKSAID